ncbi:MAG: peptidoglycan DD-metalloendopeptidase family protein [Gammaproteobacteria bacterium]|nr:peptidoglycan DD-metalloendopeptidase family protein [Gammaproteobacteria bacterium]
MIKHHAAVMLLQGLLLTALLLPPAADAAQTQQLLQEKTGKLDSLRGAIKEKKRSLESARKEKSALEGQLRQAEENISRLSQSLHDLNTELQSQQQRLDDLNSRQQQQRSSLDRQQQLLEKQLQAHYLISRQGYLKLLLNQQNPTDIGRVMTYYDYLNRARGRQIGIIQQELAQLARTEAEITRQAAHINDLLSNRYETHRKRVAEYQQRSQLVLQLSSRIRGDKSQLQQLVDDEAGLVTLIRTLQRQAEAEARAQALSEAARRSAFAALRGKLTLPARGQITARFGAPRKLGNLRWQGIELSAPQGSEVRAISGGKVVFADWLRNFGLLLIIDHGSGYMSLYGHNESLYKKAGDAVIPGDLIAAVGSSGGQQDPALYLEIRHNGTPVDPMQWFAGAAPRR